jgi:hypothetical protein
MDAKKEVRTALELHMGKVHDLVTEVCEVYSKNEKTCLCNSKELSCFH